MLEEQETKDKVNFSYEQISGTTRRKAESIRACCKVDLEKSYKAVLDCASEGAFIRDCKTKQLIYANPVICQVLGYTLDELLEMDAAELHPDYEHPFHFAGFEAMARGEITYAANVPFLCKDGRIIRTDINSTRLYSDGKYMLLSFITDVAKLASDQHALSDNERHLKLIMDQSFDGINICEYDVETNKRRLVLCNDRYVEMSGRSREELMAADDLGNFETLHCHDSARKGILNLLKAQKPYRGRSSWIRPDGKENYYDWVARPTKIGNRYYVVGVDRDVTEYVKAEEELRKTEIKYQTLVEQIPAITYTASVDEYSTIQYISPRVKDILGFTPEQCKGAPGIWIAQIHPEDTERVLKKLKETYVKGVPFSCEYRMFDAKGKVVWLKDEASVIENEGELLLQGVIFDITALKQAEQILQQKERMLRKGRERLEGRVQQRTAELENLNAKLRDEIAARKQVQSKLLLYQDRLRSLASELSLAEERTKRRIATDVHDHIGQNLAMVKMKMQLLAESVKNTSESQPVKEIMNLVSQTIDSARTLTFEISPPVLYELGLEAAVEWLLRNARNQHGLSTDFVTDGRKKALDENVSVFLFQAVRELLANVAKHAKAENVTVSVSRRNQYIRVCVADDGVGFEKQKAGVLRKKTGGFGLFSIRERLSYIGGKLSINSNPGEGAEIAITAPLAFGKKISGGKTK